MIGKKEAFPFIVVFLLLMISLAAFAADERSVDQQIKESSVKFVLIGTAILCVLICIALMYKNNSNASKILIFGAITVVILATSVYVAASTIYLNSISPSKGPVHWHADFEIWKCGQKLDMINPSGMSSLVGTSTLHEHGDDRIHLEGVPVKPDDASIGKFFKVIGGKLIPGALILPVNGDIESMRDGDMCNGAPAELQVFVYRVSNPDDTKKWKYTQTKLNSKDVPGYVISPHTGIPPGDCIIIEFGPSEGHTAHICETYKIAISKGDLNGG